jgi:hypothetical protein
LVSPSKGRFRRENQYRVHEKPDSMTACRHWQSKWIGRRPRPFALSRRNGNANMRRMP